MSDQAKQKEMDDMMIEAENALSSAEARVLKSIRSVVIDFSSGNSTRSE